MIEAQDSIFHLTGIEYQSIEINYLWKLFNSIPWLNIPLEK